MKLENPLAVRADDGKATAKIAVVSADAHRGAELAAAIRSGGGGWSPQVVQGGPLEAVAALGRSDPDVMVLDVGFDAIQALAQVERVLQIYAGMQVVLLTDDHDPDVLRSAMRVGVRDVLPRAIDTPSLLVAIRGLVDRRGAESPREAQVLAFVPCKGGGGSTFVATNTAYALAEAGEQVILIDLDLQWGDAELFLTDRKPATTLGTLASQIERVDSMLLASSLVQAHPNLGILAAPDDPVAALDIRPEHVDVILRLARANYDVVVINAGASLDAVTVRALDYADSIFPVLQLSLPIVRDARRLLRAFESLAYPAGKVKPIVNRYDKSAPLRIDEFEKTIGMQVFRTLPNDYAAASNSVNQGAPVTRLARHSAIARALRDLAAGFSTKGAAKSNSWLSRVLRRNGRQQEART